jgi:hypothetical protein
MSAESLRHAGANRDQLRFLRYRLEVIKRWNTSDEKRIRLQAIETEMGFLDANGRVSVSNPREQGASGRFAMLG